MAIDVPPPASAEPSSGQTSAGQPPVRVGVIAGYMLFATLAWGIPSVATPTLLQATLAQSHPAEKIQLAAVASITGAVLGIVLSLIVGALSDRTRSKLGARKPWIALTSVFSAVSLQVMLIAGDNFAVMLLSFACYQIGLAAMVVVLSALLPDFVPQQRLGRISSLIGLGHLIGLAGGGFTASMFLTNPRLGMSIVPWLMVIAAVVGLILLPNQSAPAEASQTRLSARELLRSLKPPMDRDFWLVFIGRLLFLSALMTIMGYKLFVMTDWYGQTEVQAAPILASASLIIAVGAGASAIVSGYLSDRVQQRRPFIIGSGIVLAAAIGVLMTAREPYLLLIFAAIASLAYGTYIAVDQALMVEVLPTKDTAAKDLGFLTVANTVPNIIAPAFAAVAITMAGYPGLFVGAAAFALISIAFIIPIRKVR